MGLQVYFQFALVDVSLVRFMCFMHAQDWTVFTA